jgi:hypothetical protein
MMAIVFNSSRDNFTSGGSDGIESSRTRSGPDWGRTFATVPMRLRCVGCESSSSEAMMVRRRDIETLLAKIHLLTRGLSMALSIYI